MTKAQISQPPSPLSLPHSLTQQTQAQAHWCIFLPTESPALQTSLASIDLLDSESSSSSSKMQSESCSNLQGGRQTLVKVLKRAKITHKQRRCKNHFSHTASRGTNIWDAKNQELWRRHHEESEKTGRNKPKKGLINGKKSQLSEPLKGNDLVFIRHNLWKKSQISVEVISDIHKIEVHAMQNCAYNNLERVSNYNSL